MWGYLDISRCIGHSELYTGGRAAFILSPIMPFAPNVWLIVEYCFSSCLGFRV